RRTLPGGGVGHYARSTKLAGGPAMLAGDTDTSDPLDRAPVPGNPAPAGWQPADAAGALAFLDRIARYCEYSCAAGSERCSSDPCDAWNLERAAASYVAGRWLDAQD
ncbi:MAG TPA: hypothetical protein VN800_01680, partial [Candidatus Acidoferrales bacterium]|nr:hypothetical protein [Candidatus Acidoferrales bacterium]